MTTNSEIPAKNLEMEEASLIGGHCIKLHLAEDDK
jgi:hypothetical protein